MLLSRRGFVLGALGVAAVGVSGCTAGWRAGSSASPSSGSPTPALDRGRVAMFAYRSDTDLAMSPWLSTNGGLWFSPADKGRYADPDPAYGVRDPSVARLPDGRYLLAYARPGQGAATGPMQSWALAMSTDLVSWQQIAVITPDLPGVTEVYAPDLYVEDDVIYAYVAVSTDHQRTFTTYLQAATVAHPDSWGRPKLVLGLPKAEEGECWFDATVQKINDDYVMIIKNEKVKKLFVARASTPIGPYTVDGNPLPTGEEPVAGPSLFQASNFWRIYYYGERNKQLRMIETANFTSWSTPMVVMDTDLQWRHGSYLTLTADEYRRLSA